jgi:mannitol-1-phosphate 5-dehydrogenase
MSTFVGFGFGAIQAGLFLYEAFHSRAFDRHVVAEVIPDVVAHVRANGGFFSVNIAHRDRVERARVGPVEIYDPAVESGREALVAAIAAAQEIATAVPSVANYVSDGPGSLHRLLARGLERKLARPSGARTVIYAAENHNHAAEILQSHVASEIAPGLRDAALAGVRFLNTVIGKMSRVVTDPLEIERENLAPITPGAPRAVLVEQFNRILISRVTFPGAPFQRGIAVFEEKDDLLPFEEAKLYGHNATHALGSYLGALSGVEFMAELRDLPGLVPFMRDAFVAESGAALCDKYCGVDPLFTAAGYAAYADDLLERMMNPFLRDSVERVARDPARKLGWNDRLVGTMRLALAHGIEPRRYGVGAAAALAALEPAVLQDPLLVSPALERVWGPDAAEQAEKKRILELVALGLVQLDSLRRIMNTK